MKKYFLILILFSISNNAYAKSINNSFITCTVPDKSCKIIDFSTIESEQKYVKIVCNKGTKAYYTNNIQGGAISKHVYDISHHVEVKNTCEAWSSVYHTQSNEVSLQYNSKLKKFECYFFDKQIKIKDTLIRLCETCGLQLPYTYVKIDQDGNILYRCDEYGNKINKKLRSCDN